MIETKGDSAVYCLIDSGTQSILWSNAHKGKKELTKVCDECSMILGDICFVPCFIKLSLKVLAFTTFPLRNHW